MHMMKAVNKSRDYHEAKQEARERSDAFVPSSSSASPSHASSKESNDREGRVMDAFNILLNYSAESPSGGKLATTTGNKILPQSLPLSTSHATSPHTALTKSPDWPHFQLWRALLGIVKYSSPPSLRSAPPSSMSPNASSMIMIIYL